MIIQAELRRKQSEYEGEPCAVDKVIELPSPRFKQFSRALLADYDFIAENKNAIRHDDDARHCLLILDAEGTDGFLVDPQGYNYARYSAFVPNARSLLTPDMGADRSYLSPAEPWRDESRDEMLRMTLRVDGKPDYTLVLPADEEYLDAVKDYAILTDEISRAWSGMSTRQYKNLKGLKKENLRDNMTTLELVLNMLAEATTTQFSRDRKPTTFQENLAVAKAGGQVAGRTRKDIESQSDTPVITAKNAAQLNQVVTDLLEGAVSDTTEESKGE